MKRRYYVILDLESEEGQALPSEEQIAAALDHSTAAEALAEATGCECSIWLPTPEQIEKWEHGKDQ